MACSKYYSTKEKTHAARVSWLLVGPCTDLFRDILRNLITEIQFPGILQKEKNTLSPILNKVQRNILYPRSGNFNGTYREFDLSLLYILLRNISGITPHQKGWARSPNPSDRSLSANIDRVREIRNIYCGHAVTVSLSDKEFQKLWQDLAVIISELEGSLPGGCSTYTDAANQIKTVTMDPEQEKKFLDMIDKQHQCSGDLKVTLITQGKELKELKAEQHRQGAKLKILVDEQHRQDKHSDSESRNILENTLAVLKAQKLKEVNIRTSGAQAAVGKLKDSHVVILTGKAGTGKTTTAYQVMCEMSDPSEEAPYTPVLIKSPEQWDKVINPIYRYIVYLDDIFGSTNLDTGAVEKWKNQLDVIFSCAKTGNIMLLIGLRRNILDEARKYHVHSILNDENIVDLSSEENFTMTDKAEMFEAYENHCHFKASELSGDIFSDYSKEYGPHAVYRFSHKTKKVILCANLYYGFPLTCFQFFSRRDFFQLGPSYFQHPDEKLFEAIENMRRAKSENRSEKVKYCVLCYVFIKGSIEINNMSENLLKTICEKLSMLDIHEIEMKDAITDLNGLYLSKFTTKHLYEFSHETILETVMVSFGQLAPDIVIRSCSRRKLHELIRTENYEIKPSEVVLKIPRRHYEDLAQRLLRGDDGEGEECMDIQEIAYGIAMHPGSDDPEFVIALCNRTMSDRLSSLFSFLLSGYIVFSVLRYRVLFRELLERYGPHHASPVKQKSEPKFKTIITHDGKILRSGSHPSTPRQQMSEPKVKITVKDIEEVLQKFFFRNDKSILNIILPYIGKYRDLSDVHGLLHMKTLKNLTVLHYCVIHGWEDMVDAILEIHTPTKTELNWSCLHLAAYAGRPVLLQKFINLRHDIKEKTSEGYSVLQTALLGLRYGHQNVSFPSNTVNYLSRSHLYTRLPFPKSNEFKKVINVLLAKNTNHNILDLSMAVDEYENNIAHYLVIYNYSDILDCLLKCDKQFVFQRNSSHIPTALHVAVYLGRPEIVRKLWKVGVRPRDSDLSLMETSHEGASFCNRVISYNFLGRRGDSNVLSANQRVNVCWNDGENEVLDIKLKTIEKVKITFGSIDEFQNISNFLSDKLELLL